jgi:hypothetical protein
VAVLAQPFAFNDPAQKLLRLIWGALEGPYYPGDRSPNDPVIARVGSQATSNSAREA